MWSILHVFLPIVDSENFASLESPCRDSQPFASKIANIHPKSHARTAPAPVHGHSTWRGRFVRASMVPGRVALAACVREVRFTPLLRLRVHRKNAWFCGRTAHGCMTWCAPCSLQPRTWHRANVASMSPHAIAADPSAWPRAHCSQALRPRARAHRGWPTRSARVPHLRALARIWLSAAASA